MQATSSLPQFFTSRLSKAAAMQSLYTSRVLRVARAALSLWKGGEQLGQGVISTHACGCLVTQEQRGSGSLGPFSVPEFRLMKSVYAGKCQSLLALITVRWQAHKHTH